MRQGVHNTGKPIVGKPDVGHVTGLEERRLRNAGEMLGFTQQDYNDFVNENWSDILQLEDMSSNRSHRFELPGSDPSPELLSWMLGWKAAR